ncbi:ComF family protein [Variovorax sp. PCZ-1]|uniref:ComF family protein n=1 Tax=Variovorax sp. PCZ-1 TaxID=2835533 RepID=UPI001BCE0F40|nr:ComF family protein [Variovorax sp. PCZ-1]MBS7808308.1 ComF family protein [Variovorax sp. PCZ-1]
MLTTLLSSLKSASLPSSCGVCAAFGRSAVCEDCLEQFAKPRHRCSTCALPLIDTAQKRCGACLTLGSELDSCHAAVDYAYPWDALLQRFKYSDSGDLSAQPALAKRLALVMHHTAGQNQNLAQALRDAQRSDWIIPVALHPERQLERGFNQANAFAQALFPNHPHIRNDLLLRIKNTAVQATLPRDTRIHNLRGAFIAAPLTAHLLKGIRVTLVDDVTTTTATLSAAAQALRQAGAHQVHAIVFARAS